MAGNGFSKRERRGIITLAVVVVLALCIGPITDGIGCTHPVVRDASVGKAPMFADDSTLSAQRPSRITVEERSEAHRRSDSIKNVRGKGGKKVKGKEGKKSKVKEGKKAKGKDAKNKNYDSSRRSMRDESI